MKSKSKNKAQTPNKTTKKPTMQQGGKRKC